MALCWGQVAGSPYSWRVQPLSDYLLLLLSLLCFPKSSTSAAGHGRTFSTRKQLYGSCKPKVGCSLLLTRCRENRYRALSQLLLHPSLPLPRFPLLLLQIPSAVRKFLPHFWKGCVLLAATMSRLVIPFYHRDIQILLLLQVCSLKHCSSGVFLWLKAAPAVPGQLGTSGHSSCSPQRVWLPEHIFRSCSQLLSLAFCSLSCLCPRNSSLKLPKLSCLGEFSVTGHTGSRAPSTAFFCCTSSFSYH